MSHAFQINPREVLGVTDSATLTELHEAYRNKSKKHHPDAGGDEWAFRILTTAYEVLSTARVMSRADEEMRREEAAQAARRAQPTAAPGAGTNHRPNPFGPVRPPTPTVEDVLRARSGVRDEVADPSLLVSAELLLIRYELDYPLGLVLGSPADRNLSCSLNIAWPSPENAGTHPLRGPQAETRPAQIQQAFDAVRKAVPPISAESSREHERFRGLISYDSAIRADEAFKVFRKALRSQGLGVAQTIRDLTIPRAWHG